MRIERAAILLLLLCGLPSSTAEASKVRPINLEEMTERAGRVFSGRVTHITFVDDTEVGRRLLVATFDVRRGVKGTAASSVTIRMLADDDRTLGLPRFAVGEQVVLFLYEESALGLTSPVGLGQGKFSVVQDKLGRSVALNVTGNRHLLRGLSDDAGRRIGALSTDGPAVDPEALLDAASRLAH
jgi:hypothetical protein